MVYGNDYSYLISRKVLPNFFLSLLVTFLGMLVGVKFVPPGVAVFMPFVALIFLIVAMLIKGKGRRGEYSGKIRISMSFVNIFAFILGIGLYPAIAYYVSDMGANMVFTGLGITVLLFGSIALYAYKSKRDFSGIGAFLFIALLALVLLGLVGLFVKIAVFHAVLAFAGILIFSGYILYDVSAMKRSDFTEEDVPMAVLDLLLDFINILLDVLRLLSFFRS